MKKLKFQKIKKRLFFILTVAAIIAVVSSAGFIYGDNPSVENTLGQNIEDILGSLDTSDLDSMLSELSEDERGIFGSSSITQRIKEIVSGKIALDYDSFFSYALQILGISISNLMPFILTLLGICVAASFINAIKGKLASQSVEKIVSFAFMAIVVVLLSAQVMILITNTTKTIMNIQKQINIFFPIILTLMTAIGSVGSVSVYQPAIAVLSSGIAELLSAVIMPMFILSVVFGIVGSISGGVKLGKLSDFFSGCIKWAISTIFFLFLAFLSIQGITASVYDSVSVRATKFAISNYVPIIGSYLSEGLNLVMAGSVLIKNAVGMCAILVLIITVIPMLLQIIVFRLSLNFVAAVAEPLDNDNVSKMLSQVSKCLKSLIAILFGLFFLYFIFMILIICTGNLVL